MTRRLWVLTLATWLTVGFLQLNSLAQAVTFKDVKMYNRSSMNSKPSKKEGYLNLDKVGRALIFVAENRVLLMIPYEWIDSMTYERKNDNLLTIQYKRRNEGQFAQFHLGGGN